MSKQQGGAYACRKWLFNQWKSAILILNEKNQTSLLSTAIWYSVRDISLSQHIKLFFCATRRSCLYNDSKRYIYQFLWM